jgi:ribose/xylose/arabinose/galactoside ABC-type transport system permease subunit
MPELHDERAGRLQSLGRWMNALGPALALLIISLVFWSLIGQTFVSYGNVVNILSQSAIVAMAALGMTFIIAAAGIDLSTGSSVALNCVLVAVVLKHGALRDDPQLGKVYLHPVAWPLLAACVGVAFATLAGTLNGALSAGLRIVPFIVTLGTMMMFRAAAKFFSSETKVYPLEKNWIAALLDTQSDGQTWLQLLTHPWRILPVGVWCVLAMAGLMAAVLHYTRFGRHVLAIGSNEQTARLCGIPVTRQRILVYTIGGLFAGFASLLQYARSVAGDPTAATGLELDVIAAVVIGGASLNGGRGSIFGTLVGALFMNVVKNGCQLVPLPRFLQDYFGSGSVGVPTYVQDFLTGAIIIVAVVIDNFRRKRTS